ncbi:hypothetical protein [Paraferrimonas sedimenticola]|uniref:Uncharacterized protein n=1 Tax=Paraferrimonas sedimenticola TaxID=375674 RepID=A0AA37W167_9GAMM|nr:hypothetical protein [Paraferrimonas sedimenticola]GLP97000.1 hypothetical protein GCM10007895_23060 [Paraferrimonas sedimenticola]
MNPDLKSILNERFPSDTSIGGSSEETTNSAIRIYGRRFYKDQTPVEYLAELLLVFISKKGDGRINENSFTLEDDGQAQYWPKDGLGLKLFSFFPSSKLETRHAVHQEKYIEAVESIKDNIEGSATEKDDGVRVVQSLLAGFTGVAKNRTWVTHSFLPASTSLISRELAWQHTKARKQDLRDWEDSKQYFSHDGHLFMARGGESLFLQLANMFSGDAQVHKTINDLLQRSEYKHLSKFDVTALKCSLEENLTELLNKSMQGMESLTSFIEHNLGDTTPFSTEKRATLGWVPKSTVPEAFLFAVELQNICSSSLSELDKLDVMQQLCCLQVLRSLSFQSQRVDNEYSSTKGFAGNYVWVASNPESSRYSATRKLSQSSLEKIEEKLYRVLRNVHAELGQTSDSRSLRQADDHGFKIFRKIGKEIGLVIPKTGQGQRFVMPPHLLKVLVAATLSPGERVRLTEFYNRVFAHFGIALAGQQLSSALEWISSESGDKNYALSSESQWIEEALKQGGFLVELSDAVSIVQNPGSKEV